ncbi:MAG: cytochrome o ubiquinol oxidase subunit I [Chlamydia sp.]
MFENLFGRLTFEAFKHGPIEMSGVVMMGLSTIGVLVLITYLGRWSWLWREWLTTVDHKKIGVMYIIASTLMLFKGVVDASMLRAQQILSVGESHGVLSPEHFQQVFTVHGTLMIFFVAMGFIFGLVNIIIPLQIGARDVAFPFLNSLSFWLYVGGMALINVSLAIGEFSSTGWLAYPPLSGIQESPGVGVDYWIWSLQISGTGTLISGINFLVTIITMRCPGMTLMRMPIFVWSVLCSMILVVFAFPILTATLGMLSLDRLLGMHFFTADGGGNPMMYINLIWAWGHPEVYILVLPAFGIFSEVVSTFSRKRLFGYTSMVIALLAITFLSFIVWLHHFFTMGAGANVNAFFGVMTMVIAVPTGVKIFNWIMTMFRGRIEFATPMLWFLGFVFAFVTGGMTGVLLSIPAVDFQTHNSLFLVAHFHSMVIGGVLFALFSGFSYWFPKCTGFLLNEKLGRYAFWFWNVGFFVAFMPLYILGFMGATRRLDHYDAERNWQQLFILSGVGILLIFCGLGMQVLQVVVSVFQREAAKDVTADPWNGRTLEWAISSPPPEYNFASLPEVTERDAFWGWKQRSKEKPLRVYTDIHMPKSTSMGLLIASFTSLAGFATVWHIWWLASLSSIALLLSIFMRTSDNHVEHTILAGDLERADSFQGRKVTLCQRL